MSNVAPSDDKTNHRLTDANSAGISMNDQVIDNTQQVTGPEVFHAYGGITDHNFVDRTDEQDIVGAVYCLTKAQLERSWTTLTDCPDRSSSAVALFVEAELGESDYRVKVVNRCFASSFVRC